MKSKKHIPIIDEKQFMEYYLQGFSDTKIASLIKTSFCTKEDWIRKLLGDQRRAMGLPRASLGTLHLEAIKELVHKGYSDIRISRELDISTSMIGHIRKRNGIRTNFIERIYKTKEDRIKGYMMRASRSSGRTRGFEFNLEYTDIHLPKYCPLLEIEIHYLNRKSNDPFGPSLDRVDNSKGYIKGNVIVISRMANSMKNSGNFDQLKTFSKNILKLVDYYQNQGARGSITDLFPNNEELSLDS